MVGLFHRLRNRLKKILENNLKSWSEVEGSGRLVCRGDKPVERPKEW